MFLSCLGFFLEVCFWFQSLVVRENAWYDFNFLELVEACFVSYHVVYLWKCSMYTWKECVFCFLGMKGSVYISVKFISSKALFSIRISLLIFCLEDLSIIDSGVLKSPTIIVLLSISFLKSPKIFLMYLGAPMLGAYIFTMFMPFWWLLLLSIMKWPSGSLFIALFWRLFCLIWVFIPLPCFPVHLLGKFVSSPSLSVCAGLLPCVHTYVPLSFSFPSFP